MRFLVAFIAFPAIVSPLFVCDAADRSTYAIVRSGKASDVSDELFPPSRIEDRFGDSCFDADTRTAWNAYLRLWHSHAEHPDTPSIRRYFSLPLDGEIEIKSAPGRAAPRILGWKRGTYQRFDSPHFVIHSQASKLATTEVAEDLERCYWIWTQVFFPLWDGSAQVAISLRDWKPNQSAADFLEKHPNRLSTRQKMNVVLFRDAGQYVAALAGHVPGVERSTGFYSDASRTTFLFAGGNEPANSNLGEMVATRRHELTHQLFREATRAKTRSGRSGNAGMPGDASRFWLVEGIAGYFESMVCEGRNATLGGWDASRMAYSRYRILVGGDFLPLSELESQGRIAVQQRHDIARWYAHSINYTHYLLDGELDANRCWLYERLAELYDVDMKMHSDAGRSDHLPEPSMSELQAFLTVSDQDLMANPARRQLQRLCLAHGEVTDAGLRAIPEQKSLEWLDLSRLPITTEAVARLVPDPSSLRQLNLEATAIDRDLARWLLKAGNLEELDLSFTRVDSQIDVPLSNMHSLETLWLTGTNVTDSVLDVVERLPRLKSLDVQRTSLSSDRIERFRQSRPDVKLNPLELR
ncbi:Leucine Rich repeats (2 copies) [Novipirellula aureliae]|uniref:Leucine Rich repeats (2 copies) n=1 Tax=Novipirellula aureliae TaxID=2527966 RepID=A0A5C6E7V3_9BACT|nr:hypothetical protein [Novipirellula aureliae]TWU44047.1 Leucine Rich repeats (2 copies) [Novipirellula aureliae]